MDTGASRSCISYATFLKVKNPKWSTKPVPRVFTADGSDLGSLGRIDMQLKLGDKEVIQDFVVCRQLKHDIILGADFGKNNCAGVEWTTKRTRVLSLNGIPVIEVEENELGLPVTAAFHVKVPPRHNSVFQVNVHGDTKGTHIISANSQFLEKNPNVFQHEISIVSGENGHSFPLVAVTNLDFAKTLHIGKGEIIGFTRPESEGVLYVATTEEVGMDPYVDNAPRNWIPPRKRKTLDQDSKTVGERECEGLLNESIESRIQQRATSNMMKVKAKEVSGKENEDRLHDESPSRRSERRCIPKTDECAMIGTETNRHPDELNKAEPINSWEEIQEVIESDFLISRETFTLVERCNSKMLKCRKRHYKSLSCCTKNSRKRSQGTIKTSERLN